MKHTYLMTLHFWIHLLRLLTTVIALVMTIWLTARPPVLRGRLSPGTPADFIPLANKLYARSILVCKILFALLIPLLLNDSLMLTFDYYRTDTYFGSVIVQTGLSIAALALAPTALGIWSPMDDFKYFQAWFLWWRPVWPTLLGCIMLWSVCSVGTLCWATLLPPRPITLQQIWKYNTKDVLLGAAASNKSSQVAPLPSIAGRPRDTPISAKQELHPVTAPPRRFITRVLFRRVSPAESRLYALTRNAFAAFAIFLIIFRAIVALSQAGNKIETRLQSKPCSNYQPMVETRIFMTDMSGTNQDSNEVSAINMTTDGGWSQACTVDHLGTEHRAKPSLDEPEFSRYNIFSCYLSTSFNGIPVSYDITVRSLNGSVLRKYSPLLWMLHNQDLDHSQNLSVASIMKDAAPAYTPAWKLRRGYHLEGEARIVKRRVITSSVWRDLLINLDPQYAEISLYPITLTSATRLANETVASARLRISFDSSFSFLGDEKKIWNPKDGLLSTSPPVVCDTIEDYRSSTVMDVIGSVGGLFALLQAAHILLFGRPLLWGLTGAKLITPFGLIGACSSQAFKRRLREQYRRQPTDDNPDPIQIGTFLRDFVIDFGPAGADATQRESRGTRNHDSFYEEKDRSESAGVRVPLMQVPSSSSPSFEAPFSIDKGTTAGTHGRGSEIV